MAYVDARGSLVFASAETGVQVSGTMQPASLRGTPVVDDGRLWVRSEEGALCVVSTATQRSLRRCPVSAAADLAPAVAPNAVYASSTDGSVYAFHTSGEPKFRVKLPEAASAQAAVCGDRLYVPGVKGHMNVLDAKTGALVWRFDAKSRITSVPVVDDGTIYVVTAGGRVYAIDE
jgi:outer membrane protein assembly factor BamB